MPSQGRGSGLVAAAVALVCLSLVLNFEVAQVTAITPRKPKTFTVNDAAGWTFGADKWAKKKQDFKAGDLLVFNYIATQHDVIVVDKDGYRKCVVPAKAKRFNTGHDQIKLRKGHNFFICGIPGHCAKGMKINVKAM